MVTEEEKITTDFEMYQWSRTLFSSPFLTTRVCVRHAFEFSYFRMISRVAEEPSQLFFFLFFFFFCAEPGTLFSLATFFCSSATVMMTETSFDDY